MSYCSEGLQELSVGPAQAADGGWAMGRSAEGSTAMETWSQRICTLNFPSVCPRSSLPHAILGALTNRPSLRTCKAWMGVALVCPHSFITSYLRQHGTKQKVCDCGRFFGEEAIRCCHFFSWSFQR